MIDSRLLMVFYGDDFTGSTDAMEVLEGQGVSTVLFVQPPSEDRLRAFAHAQCIGIAGTARTMDPAAMEQRLVPLFRQLKEMGAHVLHYKMCSTADSSAGIGSIGKIVEIGKQLYEEQAVIPILAAAPQLQRYTVFGTHFAAFRGEVYRLDRHPSMSRHPVTPMKEADLVRHFAGQTAGAVGSFSVTDLELPPAERSARWEEWSRAETDALLIDALNEAHMDSIGQLIGQSAERAPRFVIGSSGMSLALGSYWRERYGLTPRAESPLEPAQTLVLSGSCSPITNMQIGRALEQNFGKIKVDAPTLLNDEESDTIGGNLLQEAERQWRQGRSLIVYTADGPEDESIGPLHEMLRRRGEPVSASGRIIGQKLGELGKKMIARLGIKRIVLAGGDTSGFAALSLGLEALELIQRTAPGAPLCKGYSSDPLIDGIQIALKGGQLGQPDYFERVAAGGKESS